MAASRITLVDVAGDRATEDGFVNLADYLRRQFAYDEWANREVLTAIRAAGSVNERSLQLMAHILAAERVWLERLKQVAAERPGMAEARPGAV